MSLKNKCHAHKPCKGKGSYARENIVVEGVEITDEEWEELQYIACVFPDQLLEKMNKIDAELKSARERLEVKNGRE